MTKMLKEPITWQELSTHNTEKDLWIAVRGKIYDVTNWHTHPGGRDLLCLNAGRDATQIFESYHPLRANETLKKFEIGTLLKSEHPTFPPMSPFYLDLKTKIENFFIEKGYGPKYSPSMFIFSICFISLVFVSHFAALYFLPQSFLLSIVLAAISGYATAMISLMPVHEGSHASLSRSPFIWKLVGASHDIVNGASFYMWLHQHFLGHHPFTNLSDVDPDVHTNPVDIRRIKPKQEWFSHYTLQQFYAPLLYGLLAVKFRLNDLQILMFLKKNGNIRMNPPSLWHLSVFIFGKCFWVTYRIILPWLVLSPWFEEMLPSISLASSYPASSFVFGSPLLTLFCLLAVSDLITSWYLAFVFQVNHVAAPVVWPNVDEQTGVVDMDWAELQIRSTIDYAHDSKLVTFMSGGLNYQVVHHLFPYISQRHYPDIAPIILEACRRNNIQYLVLPSFFEAFKAHVSYLAQMGKQINGWSSIKTHTD